ncbi:MAG: hypothetical protein K0S84_854 [Nitrososphaera sp.]|nr:hypothetical protein [Nitrososphaera sp.]
MRKGVLVIGEITLPLVGGIVTAEHDCVEIRHIHTPDNTACLQAVQHPTCRLYKFGCNDKSVIKKEKHNNV